jgi:hypothetical protein
LRDIDVFQIAGQAIVKSFEAIYLAFDPIELGKTLAEIKRFAFPFLDVALEVFHLLTDRFATRFQSLEGVSAEKLDQFVLFGDFVVELEDFGMAWSQVLGQGVTLGFEQLKLLFRL